MASNVQAQGLTSETDANLTISDVTYTGAKGEMKGYLVVPASGGPHGAVIVVHENRGLNAHIKDVARRVALEGFVALAPDFLSDVGGTPADEEAARAMFGDLSAADVAANGVATITYLQSLPNVTGKVGAMGFLLGRRHGQ